MLTTITIEMPSKDKEKFMKILDSVNLTIEEAVEIFLCWVIDYPDEAAAWLRNQMEVYEK